MRVESVGSTLDVLVVDGSTSASCTLGDIVWWWRMYNAWTEHLINIKENPEIKFRRYITV
jgi:hypothetical protein